MHSLYSSLMYYVSLYVFLYKEKSIITRNVEKSYTLIQRRLVQDTFGTQHWHIKMECHTQGLQPCES